MTRTHGRSGSSNLEAQIPLAIDGRARSLHILSDRIAGHHAPGPIHVLNSPGNEALQALSSTTPPTRIQDLIDRGPAVSGVRCAPLDRLIDVEEITPIEQALRTVLGSGQFTSGPAIERFEHALGLFLGTENVIGTASGTDALIGALLAVGVGPGTEVIIPPNSFPGTENAVLMTGARAVLVDIRDDHLIDPEAVRAALTTRTRCVLPVHLYGRFADVETIAEICAPRGVAVVEDAAQGIGLDDVGRWSHAAALSFNPYKNLGACGKAGAVLTNHPEVAERVKSCLYHGFTPVGATYRKYYKTGPFGLNGRIDNFQAAALTARLQFLSRNNLRRTVLAGRYLRGLESLARQGRLRLPEWTDNHSWHLFTVLLGPDGSDRDTIQAAIGRHGVETDVYYPVLTHRQNNDFARREFSHVELPRAQDHNSRILQLPLYPGMTLTEQDLVIAAVHEAFAL